MPARQPSAAETRLHGLLIASGIPAGEILTEFLFAAPERRWRADFAIPAINLLVECDGGTWSQGRHNRGQGMINDHEKMNAAVMRGYRVLRATTGKQMDGSDQMEVVAAQAADLWRQSSPRKTGR